MMTYNLNYNLKKVRGNQWKNYTENQRDKKGLLGLERQREKITDIEKETRK